MTVHLVFMGVSGSGKSTVAQALRDRLGWDFAEGDDVHPPENIAKLAAGRPLTDADRMPWLRALAAWIRERDGEGRSTLMSCSALRRRYRDVLRTGADGVRFVHLRADPELLRERMGRRDHFMPTTLLGSQLRTLEPLADDEPGLTLDATRPPDELTDTVLVWLFPG